MIIIYKEQNNNVKENIYIALALHRRPQLLESGFREKNEGSFWKTKYFSAQI